MSNLPLPRIVAALCTGCGRCVEICPTQALGQVNGKAVLVCPDRCTYCALCEDLCPDNAIVLAVPDCLRRATHKQTPIRNIHFSHTKELVNETPAVPPVSPAFAGHGAGSVRRRRGYPLGQAHAHADPDQRRPRRGMPPQREPTVTWPPAPPPSRRTRCRLPTSVA